MPNIELWHKSRLSLVLVMHSLEQDKRRLLDWRDDLAVVAQGYPLSQQILRTDVSGMPLGVGRLSGSGAPLPHRTSGLYVRHAAVPAVWRHLRADRPAHHRGRQFHHRHAGNLPAIRATCAELAYTPPLNNQTLFRRDAYLCLYCGARFTYSLLSRDHVTPFSRGGHDMWSNVVSACRRCNNAKASRTPEQAGMQLLAVPFTPTYAEYIFLERPPRAGRPDGIFGRAFPAFEPAARAHATLADVSAAAIEAPARSGVVYYIDASYFIFRAYHSMPPDMVDGDGNATHALYGFARFMSDLLEQVQAGAHRRRFRSELAQRDLVPQRHLSGLQGQPRSAARGLGAAIRPVPRVLPAHGRRRIRQRANTKPTTSSARWLRGPAPRACATCW